MDIKRYLKIAEISKSSTCLDEFGEGQARFIEELNRKIQNKNYKKIAFYGTGEHTKKLLDFLKRNNFDMNKIKCLVSNENIGDKIYGLEVNEISHAKEKFNLDCIIISSYKYEDIIYDRISKQIDPDIELLKIYDCVLSDAEERIYLSPEIKDEEVGKYGNVYLEHINRYFFALGYVRNCNVLDIACGSGYGSDILAFSAKNIIGVDIDKNAIDYAKNHYNRSNLQFINESIDKFSTDKKVDVIISFETIEHINDEVSYFEMVKRNLNDQGILIVSTPVSDVDGASRINKFHTNQYTVKRFAQKLESIFSDIVFYRQDEVNNGAIALDDGNMENSITDTTYMIAVCYGIKR